MTTNPTPASGTDRVRRSLPSCALMAGLILGAGTLPATAASHEGLRAKYAAALQAYLKERRKIELISGVSAFVSFRYGETGLSAVAGTTKFYDSGERITRRTLYEIGSNTKQITPR